MNTKEFHTYACGICKTGESVERSDLKSPEKLRMFPLPKGWRLILLPQLEKDDGIVCGNCWVLIRIMVLDEYDPEDEPEG